jgi:hypothetical protein
MTHLPVLRSIAQIRGELRRLHSVTRGAIG